MSKSSVGSLRACCERNLMARAARPRTLRSRILCYHATGTPEWGINDLSLERFRAQLRLARELGFTFATATDVARGQAGPRSLAITFDDALASIRSAADVLADEGIPWTVFVVTEWADGRSPWRAGTFLGWGELERLAARPGVSVESHSVTHARFRHLEPGQVVDELFRSRDIIRSRLGLVSREFAIPMGQSGDWPDFAARAAEEAGYELVYAQSEDRRPAGTVARTMITRWDSPRVFTAALQGVFDRWEEWV